jgi:hypothetical protein
LSEEKAEKLTDSKELCAYTMEKIAVMFPGVPQKRE